MNGSRLRSPLFSSPLLQPPPSLLALLFFLFVLVLCGFSSVVCCISGNQLTMMLGKDYMLAIVIVNYEGRCICPRWLETKRQARSLEAVCVDLSVHVWFSKQGYWYTYSLFQGCSSSLKMIILVAGVCQWQAVFLFVHCSGHVSVCVFAVSLPPLQCNSALCSGRKLHASLG